MSHTPFCPDERDARKQGERDFEGRKSYYNDNPYEYDCLEAAEYWRRGYHEAERAEERRNEEREREAVEERWHWQRERERQEQEAMEYAEMEAYQQEQAALREEQEHKDA